MWRNYMTVGIRALTKNKTYAFINIVGLAIGLAAAQHGGAAGLNVDAGLYLAAEIGLQPLAGNVGGHLQIVALARLRIAIIGLELVGILRIGQRRVIAPLVADVDEQHQAGGEADREAEDVDEGIGLVLGQRPDAHNHVITPHRASPYPWFCAAGADAAAAERRATILISVMPRSGISRSTSIAVQAGNGAWT